MRIAVDTCVLAYAEGVGDEPRCAAARNVIEGLPLESVLLPVQALGELHRVLTGKAGRGAVDARDAILSGVRQAPHVHHQGLQPGGNWRWRMKFLLVAGTRRSWNLVHTRQQHQPSEDVSNTP